MKYASLYCKYNCVRSRLKLSRNHAPGCSLHGFESHSNSLFFFWKLSADLAYGFKSFILFIVSHSICYCYKLRFCFPGILTPPNPDITTAPPPEPPTNRCYCQQVEDWPFGDVECDPSLSNGLWIVGNKCRYTCGAGRLCCWFHIWTTV